VGLAGGVWVQTGLFTEEGMIIKLRFKIWRWFWLRFTLPKLTRKAQEELKREYWAYWLAAVKSNEPTLSFPEWCGTYVDDVPFWEGE
jgi:hypothetical protein